MDRKITAWESKSEHVTGCTQKVCQLRQSLLGVLALTRPLARCPGGRDSKVETQEWGHRQGLNPGFSDLPPPSLLRGAV